MERGDVTATTMARVASLPILYTHLLRVLWCLFVTVKDFKLAHATAELSRRGCEWFVILVGSTSIRTLNEGR